jgi:ribonuclease T2
MRQARLDGALVDRMLDIMPTPGLVRHEWDTHGRCSGLDAEAYFTAVRRAFEAVTIPDAFRDLARAREVSVADLKAEFERANASIRTDGIAVVCDGRYLEEVRLCFDPTLRPRRCRGDVGDRCRPGTLVVLPAR